MGTEPQTLQDGATDPNIHLPRHVREASAAADALHTQVYAEPEPPPAVDQVVPPETPPAPEPQVVQPQAQPTVTATVTDNFVGAPSDQDLKDSAWAGRYNSMRGRWEASQRQLGAQQEQMSQLADELTRTQQLLLQNGSAPHAGTHSDPGQHHEQLITAQDRETYGEELIDVARRAALEATAPEMNALRAQNEDLKKRVITNDQRLIYSKLDQRLPNWKSINASPEFKRWLALPNIYTGQVRGQMLNAAFKAADAPKVVALFQDFVTEVIATGGTVPGAQATAQQQVPDPQQSRQAAVAIETLAAPGRARPAGGDTPHVPAEKPTYTRQQIAQFYADVRRNGYAGREADKNRIETDIIAAQREGRVRG